jgi:hypothetical protein
MDAATAGAFASLAENGLSGICILALGWGLFHVHGLYVKSNDARIAEGLSNLEKLSQAIHALDKLR